MICKSRAMPKRQVSLYFLQILESLYSSQWVMVSKVSRENKTSWGYADDMMNQVSRHRHPESAG